MPMIAKQNCGLFLNSTFSMIIVAQIKSYLFRASGFNIRAGKLIQSLYSQSCIAYRFIIVRIKIHTFLDLPRVRHQIGKFIIPQNNPSWFSLHRAKRNSQSCFYLNFHINGSCADKLGEAPSFLVPSSTPSPTLPPARRGRVESLISCPSPNLTSGSRNLLSILESQNTELFSNFQVVASQKKRQSCKRGP